MVIAALYHCFFFLFQLPCSKHLEPSPGQLVVSSLSFRAAEIKQRARRQQMLQKKNVDIPILSDLPGSS
jgi:hypothetical protein